MKKLLSKKEVIKVKSLPYDPASMAEPADAKDYRQRGTAYCARKEYQAKAEDLEGAVIRDGNSIDTFYMLGMVFKAMESKNEAVSAFSQVLELIKDQSEGNKVKNNMLRRLALGHINSITQGDWNLEKEIWQRKT